MLLKEIQFKKTDDVYSLVKKLAEKNILTLDNDGKIVSIDADQFLVAENGNTYILHDILALSNEAANSLDFKFLGKDGNKYSSKDIRSKIKDTKLLLLQNNALVNSLLTAKLSLPEVKKIKGKKSPHKTPQKLLNIIVDKCPITHGNFIFPVVANSGHDFERYAINQWLLSHTTNPITNLRLTNQDLVPNNALKDLIWVNFNQRQTYKYFLKKRHTREQNAVNKKKYQDTISDLEDEKNSLVEHLKSQIEVLRDKKEIIDSMLPIDKNLQDANENAFRSFPDLKKLGKRDLKNRRQFVAQAVSSLQPKVNIFQKIRQRKIDNLAVLGVTIGVMVLVAVVFAPPVGILAAISAATAFTSFIIAKLTTEILERMYLKKYRPLKMELDAIDAILKAKEARKLLIRDPKSESISREIKEAKCYLEQINGRESSEINREIQKNNKDIMPSDGVQQSFQNPTSSTGYLLRGPKDYKTIISKQEQVTDITLTLTCSPVLKTSP